jgi:hypothetical protein
MGCRCVAHLEGEGRGDGADWVKEAGRDLRNVATNEDDGHRFAMARASPRSTPVPMPPRAAGSATEQIVRARPRPRAAAAWSWEAGTACKAAWLVRAMRGRIIKPRTTPPARRLCPGASGAKRTIAGTTTMSPQNPKTTAGTPMSSSIIRWFHRSSAGGA